MESSIFGIIAGLKVLNSILGESGLGVRFDKGVDLIIYNNFNVSGFGLVRADQLCGRTVADVIEGEDAIVITFIDGTSIEVDMRSDAYNGPEALQLRIPDRPIVIWN